jgi:hypothetical protein
MRLKFHGENLNMRSSGSAGKGSKYKGCPITCQAGTGVIPLGGQHHAPTSLLPGMRHGTYVQEVWWTLGSVWVRPESIATTRVRTPVLLCRLRHQVEAAKISRQPAHESDEVVSRTHRPP